MASVKLCYFVLISPLIIIRRKKINGNGLIKVMIVRFPNLLYFMLVAEACKVMIVCNRRRRCVTGQIRRALVNQRPDTRLGH